MTPPNRMTFPHNIISTCARLQIENNRTFCIGPVRPMMLNEGQTNVEDYTFIGMYNKLPVGRST